MSFGRMGGMGRGFGRLGSPLGGAALPSLYLGQVATKSRIMTNRDTTNKQFNSRSHHIARDNITALKLVLPNWYWARKSTATEGGSGGNITYTASVEYPEGVFTQALFSGATSIVTASNTEGVSDYINVTIPAGASFWVRVFGTAVTGRVFLEGDVSPSSRQCDTNNGEVLEYAVSGLADATMGGTITASISTDAAQIFCPVAIVAMTRKPSVLITASDSRAWGYQDVFDSSGDLGEIARSVGASLGYINAACAGDSFSNYITAHTRRAALKQYVSHVVMQAGINSLRAAGQNKSAATVLAEQQTVLGYFSDKRCFTCTVAPRAGGTPWASASQSPDANAAEIVLYNEAQRAGVAGAIGHFDIAAATEHTLNSVIWKFDGTAFKYTADGLHESQFAQLQIVASGVVNLSLITRAGL